MLWVLMEKADGNENRDIETIFKQFLIKGNAESNKCCNKLCF